MTNKERLIHALFEHEGREHIDIKFCMGSGSAISPDQLWSEGASAFLQIDSGSVEGDEDFNEDFKEVDLKASF